jgi:actin-related protein
MCIWSKSRNLLESGHDTTYTVSIYEGYALKDYVSKINIGGSDVINFLIQLLTERKLRNDDHIFTFSMHRIFIYTFYDLK